jgi:hypothetical protein
MKSVYISYILYIHSSAGALEVSDQQSSAGDQQTYIHTDIQAYRHTGIAVQRTVSSKDITVDRVEDTADTADAAGRGGRAADRARIDILFLGELGNFREHNSIR